MLASGHAAHRLTARSIVLCALFVVAPLLALPVAAEDMVQGHLSVAVPVSLADHVALRPADVQRGPSADDSRTSPCGTNALADQERPPGELLSTQAGTLWFQETDTEWACAEARVYMDVPPGADAFTLTFDYTRTGGSVVLDGAVMDARQWVTLYEAGSEPDDRLAFPARCLRDELYVAEDSGPASRTSYSVDLSLRDCGIGPEVRTLVLGFGFADIQGAGVEPLQSPNTRFSASVRDVGLAFHDIPVDADMERRSELDPSNDVLGYTLIGVGVPVQRGWSMDVVLEAEGIGSLLGLYQGTFDDPGANNASLAGLVRVEQEPDGASRIILPPELWAKGDHFVATFRGPGTSDVNVLRMPVAALALLAPLAAGVIAQRNLNHLHRSARGRVQALRHRVQAALILAWTIYIIVAFILLIRDAGVGMAARPLKMDSILAYIALGISTVTMVIAGVVAQRREMEIVLDDLSELERIQSELERSNRELEQFAYVASHDLKEPLRMVAGYTQLLDLRYGQRLDGQGKEFLEFAAEGAHRLQRMVDDLLAYSRVRTDRAQFRQVRLDDVVTIVRGHLRQLLQERNVSLIAEDLPVIHGDQGQLVQLLLNLVQNAVKFSPQDAPVVEITARRSGDGTIISVRDEGIGIEPKQQARIFDIFQRLHLREEYEGNGIGLAMCKKIAEQLGGDISVDSAPGEGATFHVYLPDLGDLGGTPRRTSRAADSSA